MQHALKTAFLVSATGLCFFFFWLGALILSWIVLPLIWVSMGPERRRDRIHRCQEIVGAGFRLFLGFMRNVRTLVFRPRGVTLDLPDGPFMMIANHPTLIDVTAVMSVHPRICCVAKSELFRSVYVGRLLRFSAQIEGGDRGSMVGATVIGQALDRIDSGLPVLMFPEGTRSPAGGLRRFRPGAFEIALRAGVPIVPVLIKCDPPTLTKGLSWYALPRQTAYYEISQLPTRYPSDLSDDSRLVARHFQSMYQSAIDAQISRRESPAA